MRRSRCPPLYQEFQAGHLTSSAQRQRNQGRKWSHKGGRSHRWVQKTGVSHGSARNTVKVPLRHTALPKTSSRESETRKKKNPQRTTFQINRQTLHPTPPPSKEEGCWCLVLSPPPQPCVSARVVRDGNGGDAERCGQGRAEERFSDAASPTSLNDIQDHPRMVVVHTLTTAATKSATTSTTTTTTKTVLPQVHTSIQSEEREKGASQVSMKQDMTNTVDNARA